MTSDDIQQLCFSVDRVAQSLMSVADAVGSSGWRIEYEVVVRRRWFRPDEFFRFNKSTGQLEPTP